VHKIIAQLFCSLDGVVEATETWHFAFWNDQMQAAFGGLLERADTGRASSAPG
jgi:hypothetical protein